jgi:protein transport protein DSL1/ZW10
MQQHDIEDCIDQAIGHIRSMAVTWEEILGRSVWNQAVGALADTISSKFLADIMDMTSISQDEAYSTAQAISKVTELDELFLPSRAAGTPKEAGEMAATAQYVPTWLRLQFLSEVLQSNLNEVKFLWFESELSLHFTSQEVVDLVNMSFEANARTKEVVREITHNPHPIDM